MRNRRGIGTFDTQTIQILYKLPAVACAAAPHRQFAHHRRKSLPILGIICTTRGHHDAECGRFQGTNRLGDQSQAVGEAMRFYKIALGDVVAFHDELDLPPGKLRIKVGGGNAGHNGLRSISAHCENDYRRVRMGIGHPGDRALVTSFVLSDFSKDERPWVEDLCQACADFAEALAKGDDTGFQNKIHLFMKAQGHDTTKDQNNDA